MGKTPVQHAKGFVRQPRNAVVPVATITDDMRAAAPAKLDYTGTATSPVKDQGGCGSCWAFSATQGVESAVYMQHGTMPILSRILGAPRGLRRATSGCQWERTLAAL